MSLVKYLLLPVYKDSDGYLHGAKYLWNPKVKCYFWHPVYFKLKSYLLSGRLYFCTGVNVSDIIILSDHDERIRFEKMHLWPLSGLSILFDGVLHTIGCCEESNYLLSYLSSESDYLSFNQV